MHEVAADRVPPRHVAPRVPERVVLVEEVVLALVVDEPVRVVHPVLGRREVELRAIELLIARAGRRRGVRHGARQRGHGDRERDGGAAAQPASPSDAGLTVVHRHSPLELARRRPLTRDEAFLWCFRERFLKLSCRVIERKRRLMICSDECQKTFSDARMPASLCVGGPRGGRRRARARSRCAVDLRVGSRAIARWVGSRPSLGRSRSSAGPHAARARDSRRGARRGARRRACRARRDPARRRSRRAAGGQRAGCRRSR